MRFDKETTEYTEYTDFLPQNTQNKQKCLAAGPINTTKDSMMKQDIDCE